MFTRNCPECGAEIIYKFKYLFDKAVENNSKCKLSCHGLLTYPENKICSKCKMEKSKDQFNKSSIAFDGLNSKCIDCRTKERKALADRDKSEIIYPENKQCDTCLEIKPKEAFHNKKHSKDGLADDCKECANAKRIIYYKSIIPIDKVVPENKRCPKCEQVKLANEFYPSNRSKDGLGAYCRKCDNKMSSQYRKENKEKINKKYLMRLKTDPQEKIRHNIRNRISKAINGKIKPMTIKIALGCTRAELMNYLEKQFQSGMTFENYGKWHVDHIMPLSSFDLTDPEQFRKACHYTNLQPLWAKDNISKSDKIPETINHNNF
ncbi:MAG: hypothetical protein WC523_04420 [Patescibacteria group bacterium]